ncbi:MAG: hypothetical protein SFV19_00670 [Rhodospirillaceae bacterium]|nr:hypothetical protein [Rhodospirillaceae bacterium]
MTQDKKPVTVSREALYDQVWTTPVDRLAESYGISGRGLGKICARLNIPVPPRGYWARKAAGQKVVKYKLPARSVGIPEETQIAPTPPPTEPEKLSPDMQTVFDEHKASERQIPLAKTLSNPHPFVARWLEVNRKEIADHRNRDWGWKTERIDGTPLQKRRLLILSALFKEIERVGHHMKKENDYQHSFYAEIQGQKVTFEVSERIRQVRRELTPEERASGWRDQKWRQEQVPTGRLRFRLLDTFWLKGLKTDWIEDDQTPLESTLPEMVAALVTAGAMLAEHEKKRREEERLRQIEEHKRYKKEQERKRQAARWCHVLDMTKRWKQAAEASAFLDQLELKARNETGGQNLPEALSEWLSWARQRMQDHNPMSYYLKDLVAQNESVNEWNYKP